MSNPYLFSRPSGYVVRFLVPTACRLAVGRRYIVRSLYTSDLDQARLHAAILAVKLSNIFNVLKKGNFVANGDNHAGDMPFLRDLRIEKATAADGTVLEGVTIDNDNDRMLFDQMLRRGEFNPQMPQLARRADTSGMLSDRICSYLETCKTGGYSPKTLGDAKFALEKILLELCRDKPLHEFDTNDADKVVNALMRMPPNASKKKEYVGLSTAQILEKAHSINAPKLAARTIDKYLDRVRAFFNDAVKKNTYGTIRSQTVT